MTKDKNLKSLNNFSFIFFDEVMFYCLHQDDAKR